MVGRLGTTLVLVAATAGGIRAASAPQQLITSAGELLPSVVADLAGALPSNAPLSLIACVRSKCAGRTLLNSLFGTGFSTELPLPEAADNSGAWIAAAPSAPGVLLMNTEASDAKSLDDADLVRGADDCSLDSFALAVADAVIVHSPCAKPSAALVTETFETLFVEHLTANPEAVAAPQPRRTMLVYVQPATGDATKQQASAVAAAEAAWARASASSPLKGVPLSALFELVPVSLPSAKKDKAAHDAAVAELRRKLRSLHADGFGKVGKPDALPDAATAAWAAVQAAAGTKPSDVQLRDRYFLSQAYEAGLETAQSALRDVTAQVSGSGVCRGFGRLAEDTLESALAAYDAAVADVSADAADAADRQREKLVKTVQADVRELFMKQQHSLKLNTFNMYKSQLLKVMSRAGSVAQWQQERLRRSAEKSFDAQLASLIVPSLGGPSRKELTEAFSRALTAMATKFIDSPTMQLQAIGSMRRRTSKGQKPPRGLRWGLGLTGAIRNQWGGGQGNLQSFVGFVDGLNSAHLMFANDGAIPDSTGSEPPLLRFQPKLNFDVSI